MIDIKLKNFQDDAVDFLFSKTSGWHRYQPAIGISMGFDDLKFVEVAQFIRSVLTVAPQRAAPFKP